jgi:hypothetical protein
MHQSIKINSHNYYVGFFILIKNNSRSRRGVKLNYFGEDLKLF